MMAKGFELLLLVFERLAFDLTNHRHTCETRSERDPVEKENRCERAVQTKSHGFKANRATDFIG